MILIIWLWIRSRPVWILGKITLHKIIQAGLSACLKIVINYRWPDFIHSWLLFTAIRTRILFVIASEHIILKLTKLQCGGICRLPAHNVLSANFKPINFEWRCEVIVKIHIVISVFPFYINGKEMFLIICRSYFLNCWFCLLEVKLWEVPN